MTKTSSLRPKKSYKTGLILCEGKAELYFFRFILQIFKEEFESNLIKLNFSPNGIALNENKLGMDQITSHLIKRIQNDEYSFIFVVYDLGDINSKNLRKACKKFHSPRITHLASDICIDATLFKLLSHPSASAPKFSNPDKAKSRFHTEFCPGKKVSNKGAHNFDWEKSPISKEELLAFDFLRDFFKKLKIKK